MKGKGLLFVMSAPAGTGKTTLIHRLTLELPNVVQSISFNTRAPRDGEINGVHYNFVSREEFERKIKAGEFLEYVELYGNYYGTTRKWVEDQLSSGKHVFLVIDTQGAMILKERIDGCFIFILPPTMDSLKDRLTGRRTESQEEMQKRIEWAKKEIAVADMYDYNIINDNLDVAYGILRSIVIAEEHRVRRKI